MLYTAGPGLDFSLGDFEGTPLEEQVLSVGKLYNRKYLKLGIIFGKYGGCIFHLRKYIGEV